MGDRVVEMGGHILQGYRPVVIVDEAENPEPDAVGFPDVLRVDQPAEANPNATYADLCDILNKMTFEYIHK